MRQMAVRAGEATAAAASTGGGGGVWLQGLGLRAASKVKALARRCEPLYKP